MVAYVPVTARRRQGLCLLLAVAAVLLLLGAMTRSMASEESAVVLVPAPEAEEQPAPAEPAEPDPPLRLPGPPTFDALRKWEDDLPQHDLDLPFPEGRTGRYVKFSNQAKMLGWNNCLNEQLMNAHLAYMARRAYVFQEYVWAPQHYPWPAAQHPAGGPKTPLNAIISGPMAGGPWAPSDPAPRSVSDRFFDIVCPPAARLIINTTAIKPALVDLPGDAVFAAWLKVLADEPARCVEVVPPPYEVDGLPQTFDLWIWGSARVLSLWDSFSTSPTSTLLGPSPIVRSAVARNAYLFAPRRRVPRAPVPAGNPFAHTLAVHVRRGDYLAHCRNLADWGSTYYSWALLPVLPDSFAPGDAAAALAHCLPSLEQLVTRIGEARDEYRAAGANSGAAEREARRLDTIYLLTNTDPASAEADREWIAELKGLIGRQGGWGVVVTSGELVLDAEQMEVGMAVDMQIAREAAVFLGNGWSSFTSNIIHQRLVDGREPISIRLT